MKKNIYKWLVPVLLITFILVSCDEYLDIQPKGVQLLTTVEDYEQWLNSTDLKTSLPNELNYLADNVDFPGISPTLVDPVFRSYTWQEQFSENISSVPVIWTDHYKCIYYFNTVLKGIDRATGGTEQQKESLKAEALLGRAFEYLYLVNLYGKLYNANTANEDLAVPFVISNDLADPVPERSTVQDVYDHIIADITTAIPDLPVDNSENRFRGSVAAAYSVLARAYLYMGDYTKAAYNAQLALNNGPNTILDYSIMASVVDIPHLRKRADAIYARLNTTYIFSVCPELTFLQSFDTTDLRLQFYYTELGDYSFTIRGWSLYYPTWSAFVYPNWGPSVAEMRLIIAETAARSYDLTTAIDQLDLLRSKRFSAEDYIKFESTDQEEVLQKVLDERNFELAFSGMRWFDMRRLDAEGRMPTVNRYDGSGNVIATLSPGSAKYTLKIPIQELYFHPDWPQNPED